jgi:hypothetical protein
MDWKKFKLISKIYDSGTFHSLIVHVFVLLTMALIVFHKEYTSKPIIIQQLDTIEKNSNLEIVEISFENSSIEELDVEILENFSLEEEIIIELENNSYTSPSSFPKNLRQEIASSENKIIPEDTISPIEESAIENRSEISEGRKTFNKFLVGGSQLAEGIKDSGFSGGVGSGFEDRLKAYGAKSGDVQVSIAWNTVDDIDLHVEYVNNGFRDYIFWGSRYGYSSGFLDIDMNGAGPVSNTPIENIVWPHNSNPSGSFRIGIHFYRGWSGMRNVPVTLRVQTKNGIYMQNINMILGQPLQVVYNFTN